MNKWILFLTFLIGAYALNSKQTPISNNPLILDHADQMNASKMMGVFDLSGAVQMHHDAMKLRCDKALWNQNMGILDAQGSIVFEHPEALLRGDSGRYEKSMSKASLWGKPVYQTRDQSFWLSGDRMEYFKDAKLVTVQTKSALTDIPKAKKNEKTDTLFITSDRMSYNDSLRVAYAWGGVKVRQGALRLRCDSLRYQRNDSSLWLMGHAYGKYKGWKSTAQMMHSVGGGKRLKLLEGFGLAEGVVYVDSLGKDTLRLKNRMRGDTLRAYFKNGRLDEVKSFGNSSGADFKDSIRSADSLRSLVEGPFLWAKFKDGQMESVRVYPSAKGSFFGDQFSEIPSETTGDTLLMQFMDGKAKFAKVNGNAYSKYHYYKNQSIEGRNETHGDEMIFTFDKGKVRLVDIQGELAKGTWTGLKKSKK